MAPITTSLLYNPKTHTRVYNTTRLNMCLLMSRTDTGTQEPSTSGFEVHSPKHQNLGSAAILRSRFSPCPTDFLPIPTTRRGVGGAGPGGDGGVTLHGGSPISGNKQLPQRIVVNVVQEKNYTVPTYKTGKGSYNPTCQKYPGHFGKYKQKEG